MLTKSELARRCGVSVALIEQHLRDGTIPAHYVTKDSGERGRAGKIVQLAPVSAALVLLVLQLGATFGFSSALPKRLARAGTGIVERLWRADVVPGEILIELVDPPLRLAVSTDFLTAARAAVSQEMVA